MRGQLGVNLHRPTLEGAWEGAAVMVGMALADFVEGHRLEN